MYFGQFFASNQITGQINADKPDYHRLLRAFGVAGHPFPFTRGDFLMISMDIVTRIVEIPIAEGWPHLGHADECLGAWLAPQSGLLPARNDVSMPLGSEWVEYHSRGTVGHVFDALNTVGATELIPCIPGDSQRMIVMHVTSSEIEGVFTTLHNRYKETRDACHFIGGTAEFVSYDGTVHRSMYRVPR